MDILYIALIWLYCTYIVLTVVDQLPHWGNMLLAPTSKMTSLSYECQTRIHDTYKTQNKPT